MALMLTSHSPDAGLLVLLMPESAPRAEPRAGVRSPQRIAAMAAHAAVRAATDRSAVGA